MRQSPPTAANSFTLLPVPVAPPRGAADRCCDAAPAPSLCTCEAAAPADEAPHPPNPSDCPIGRGPRNRACARPTPSDRPAASSRIGQIDDHFDRRQPIENPQQLLRLGRNLLLRRIAQMTMPGGNLNLHQSIPNGSFARQTRSRRTRLRPLQTAHSSLICPGRQTGSFPIVLIRRTAPAATMKRLPDTEPRHQPERKRDVAIADPRLARRALSPRGCRFPLTASTRPQLALQPVTPDCACSASARQSWRPGSASTACP